MTGSLLARLDAQWQRLAGSPAVRATVAGWAATGPALAGVHNMETLRAVVHDRRDRDRADAALATLVRIAAQYGDPLATQVVLHLLLPGAVRLAQRLGGPDALSEVLAELTIRIRTYPWRRRPRRVAANLLLDTWQRLTRTRARSAGELPWGLMVDGPPVDAIAHRGPRNAEQAEAAAAVRHLLWWARRRGVLTALQADLLALLYLHGLSIDQLTGILGRSRSTLYNTRNTAHARLRHAAGLWRTH